jgi:hypothetical protein
MEVCLYDCAWERQLRWDDFLSQIRVPGQACEELRDAENSLVKTVLAQLYSRDTGTLRKYGIDDSRCRDYDQRKVITRGGTRSLSSVFESRKTLPHFLIKFEVLRVAKGQVFGIDPKGRKLVFAEPHVKNPAVDRRSRYYEVSFAEWSTLKKWLK